MSRESFLKKALDKSGCLYYNIYLCCTRDQQRETVRKRKFEEIQKNS